MSKTNQYTIQSAKLLCRIGSSPRRGGQTGAPTATGRVRRGQHHTRGRCPRRFALGIITCNIQFNITVNATPVQDQSQWGSARGTYDQWQSQPWSQSPSWQTPQVLRIQHNKSICKIQFNTVTAIATPVQDQSWRGSNWGTYGGWSQSRSDNWQQTQEALRFLTYFS